MDFSDDMWKDSNGYLTMPYLFCSRLVCGFFVLLAYCVETWCLVGRFPIGALFDKRSGNAAVAGFRYVIDKHNTDKNVEFHLQFDEFDETLINIQNSFDVAQSMCRQMESGVFLFFGMKDAKVENIIQSFTKTFHMPFISPRMSLRPPNQNKTYEIHMHPSYTQTIVDVIKYEKWKKLLYVYDSDEGLWRLQQIFERLRSKGLHVRIRGHRLPSGPSVHEELRRLDRSWIATKKIIVLDLTGQAAYSKVMNQIAEVGMNKQNYHYLLGTFDIKRLNLQRFRHGGVNITGFQLLNDDNPMFERFMRKWSKQMDGRWIDVETALTIDAVDVIIHALSRMLMNSSKTFQYTFRRGSVYNYNRTRGIPCSTRPVVPWMHGDAILRAIKQVHFTGLTGEVSFDEDGYRKDYSLEVYELGLESGPKHIGKWTPGDGFNNSRKEEDTPEHKTPNNTRDGKLRIVSIISPPFLTKVNGENASQEECDNSQFDGYCKDLIVSLMKKMGYGADMYCIHLVKDKEYGRQINGTWNGIIGELKRGEADIAVAPLTITSDRETAVDFSKPYMDVGISIQIKKPEKQTPGVFSFMEPVSIRVWMCILIGYIGISSGLFLVSRFSPYEWKNANTVEGTVLQNEFSFLNSFWFSMGALMLQGSDSCPRKTKVETYSKMWQKMSTAQPSVFVKTEEEGVARVRTGKYAFLLESSSNDFINNRNPCDTMRVGPDLNQKSLGIATPRPSKHREIVNIKLLELIEEGVLHILRSRWWIEKGECGVGDGAGGDSKKRSLSLSNVAGVFYILIGGLVLAVLVSIYEFCQLRAHEEKAESKLRAEETCTTIAPSPTSGENGGFFNTGNNISVRSNIFNTEDHYDPY